MSEISPPNIGDPTYDELESLFVNNAKLERIEKFLNRFNPIKTMKMERMEIRHSAILAWLLTPQETHGLGDYFLKSFLAEALRGQSDLGRPTALDIAQSDLRDADVRTEWLNIDIFIQSDTNKWAFVLENKFGSTQRDGQLEEYAERAKRFYDPSNTGYKLRGVFLTLDDEDPQDPEFAPIKYHSICEILTRCLSEKSSQISSEVAVFLEHYLEILKDETGMSDEQTEMENLARQLYREHRKVLDFVIEHGAGTDFAIAARSVFGEDINSLETFRIGEQEFVFSSLNNRIAGFIPTGWYQAFEEDNHDWRVCGNWWTGYPLIIWTEVVKRNDNASGSLKLHAEVGPIPDASMRKKLIMAMEGFARSQKMTRVGFGKGATEEGRRFSRFFKSNSEQLTDVNNPEQIAEAIKKIVGKFQKEFDLIGSDLPMMLRQVVEVDQ